MGEAHISIQDIEGSPEGESSGGILEGGALKSPKASDSRPPSMGGRESELSGGAKPPENPRPKGDPPVNRFAVAGFRGANM